MWSCKMLNLLLVNVLMGSLFLFENTIATNIKVTIYTVDVPTDSAQFNLWKYAPDRFDGNGLPSEGDYLIAQGHANESGQVIWDNGESYINLTDYGAGFYGINEVVDAKDIICNWNKWDEKTFYRTFEVINSDSFFEFTCINSEDYETEKMGKADIYMTESTSESLIAEPTEIPEKSYTTELTLQTTEVIEESEIVREISNETQDNDVIRIAIGSVSLILSLAILGFMIYSSKMTK